LHDDLSQRLAHLGIQLDNLRLRVADDDPELARELKKFGQQAADMTEDVHRLSHGLHSSVLEHLGLVPALRSLIAEYSQQRNIPHRPPESISLCLYRVVQEALNNIARHSGAKSARIELALRNDGYHLTVEDDGNGFEAKSHDNSGGLGFISMKERVRIVHGEFHIRSARGEGTRVDVWVPVASVPWESESDVGTKPEPVEGSHK
jgi:signal transduction histidine kinase